MDLLSARRLAAIVIGKELRGRPDGLELWPLAPVWLPAVHTGEYADFLNVFVHDINLLRYLVDGPVTLQAVDFRRANGRLALLDCAGVPGALEMAVVDLAEWREGVEIVFEKGVLTIEFAAPMLRNVPARVSLRRGGKAGETVTPDIPWSWAFKRQARAFVDDVLDGTRPLADGADALEDLRLAEAMWRYHLRDVDDDGDACAATPSAATEEGKFMNGHSNTAALAQRSIGGGRAAASPVHHRVDCRACGGRALQVVVQLAPIPITTPNVGFGQGARHYGNIAGIEAPLDLHRCGDCGHLQLLDAVDPDLQYGEFLYTTSISLGLPAHFERMGADLIDALELRPGSTVIEIGSNDGTLLRLFQAAGMRVLGIDPAREIAERASAMGIETLATFFTAEAAVEIVRDHGPADLVIANNTLANIDDLGDCLVGVRTLLKDDGVFVFETSYGADVIDGLLLDTIYHEHLSYFMAETLPGLMARHDMALFDLVRVETKGGSLRGFVQPAGGPRADTGAAMRFIADEHARGMTGPAPYERFRARLDQAKAALATALDDCRLVAGYGASVGTVTLLHEFDLADRFVFVVDDKPLGRVLRGPGYEIPIVGADRLYSERPDAVVLLAWRYGEKILARHGAYMGAGGRFVLPLPEVRVVEDTSLDR